MYIHMHTHIFSVYTHAHTIHAVWCVGRVFLFQLPAPKQQAASSQ